VQASLLIVKSPGFTPDMPTLEIVSGPDPLFEKFVV
jgi:hypothetical protein